MKQVGINFVVPEEKRNQFNSILSLKGLKTKDVMTVFVEKILKEPEKTLKFIGY